MAGYQTILQIRKLEEEINKLGFMLCHSKYGVAMGHIADLIAIKPKDKDSLPIYARDAELFCGTIDELTVWVQGVQWARDYDRMLFGKKHEANRERKEQDERNRILVRVLKQEAKEEKA